MDEMEEKLGAVLNNPQMMQQIMTLAQSLKTSPPPAPKQETPVRQESASSLPAIDPAMLQRIAGMASQGSIDKDQKELLKALSPYLSRDRLGKLEKAMQAARMAQIATTLINQGGLSFLTGR